MNDDHAWQRSEHAYRNSTKTRWNVNICVFYQRLTQPSDFTILMRSSCTYIVYSLSTMMADWLGICICHKKSHHMYKLIFLYASSYALTNKQQRFCFLVSFMLWACRCGCRCCHFIRSHYLYTRLFRACFCRPVFYSWHNISGSSICEAVDS